MSESTETKGMIGEEIIEDVIAHIRETSKDGQLVEKSSLAVFLEEPKVLTDDETTEEHLEANTLAEDDPEDLEEKKAMMAALLSALEESDAIELKMLTDDAGAEFFYSAADMSDRYASIVMSVSNKNYLKLIADTVRHESQKYPRATHISLFTKKPYNLTESQLLGLLSAMSTDNNYADLKYTEASNGEKFLYSERHLTARHAKSLAEWEAVTSKEIP